MDFFGLFRLFLVGHNIKFNVNKTIVIINKEIIKNKENFLELISKIF